MAVIFTWRWKLFACVFFTHVLRTEKLMRHWKPWIHIYMGSNWTAHEEPKKFVKSPCYVTIDISRAFPPKQTQVKICLQIQRELSGGQFSLSLYLKLFRTISNSSYNTTASSRHRSVWKKKITEKKISALAEGLDSKFFVVVSTSCVCANHSEIFPRSRSSWPAF